MQQDPSTDGSAPPPQPLPATRRRPPSPCPRCDADLRALDREAPDPKCPACGLNLLPTTVAGFFRRLLATTIDLVLALIVAIPMQMMVHWLLATPPPITGGSLLASGFQLAATDPLDMLVWTAPAIGVVALYYLLFLILMGYTLGQRLARIRIIDATGNRPHPVRTSIRLVGAGVGLLPLGLGGMWIAFDREKRGFHDHVAGTYVVRLQ